MYDRHKHNKSPSGLTRGLCSILLLVKGRTFESSPKVTILASGNSLVQQNL